jgi:hypothetical protein
METRRISIGALTPNTGQIEGLPSNPRQWTQTEIDRLAKSLKETPELFEMRPLLVYEQAGEYVILGGNLRFEGARKNKDKDCPAIVIPADTPVDKLKEIVIKDNGSFGDWDISMLIADWGGIPFEDWGLPSWINTNEGDLETIEDLSIETHAAAGENKSGFSAITFLFPKEEAQVVNDWIAEHSKDELVVNIVDICRSVEVK